MPPWSACAFGASTGREAYRTNDEIVSAEAIDNARFAGDFGIHFDERDFGAEDGILGVRGRNG